jgi:hypothetical protein
MEPTLFALYYVDNPRGPGAHSSVGLAR